MATSAGRPLAPARTNHGRPGRMLEAPHGCISGSRMHAAPGCHARAPDRGDERLDVTQARMSQQSENAATPDQ